MDIYLKGRLFIQNNDSINTGSVIEMITSLVATQECLWSLIGSIYAHLTLVHKHTYVPKVCVQSECGCARKSIKQRQHYLHEIIKKKKFERKKQNV